MTITPLTGGVYDTDIVINGVNEGSFDTEQDGTIYDINLSTSWQVTNYVSDSVTSGSETEPTINPPQDLYDFTFTFTLNNGSGAGIIELEIFYNDSGGSRTELLDISSSGTVSVSISGLGIAGVDRIETYTNNTGAADSVTLEYEGYQSIESNYTIDSVVKQI